MEPEAYFQRIRYKGERSPSFETLQSLILYHTESIPFENLNPFLKWPVHIDLPSLEQKLIHQGRGGYCYEQNGLFKHVLEYFGFSVIGLSARVLMGAAENTIPPSSHMILLVRIGGTAYLADVGFGRQTPTAPLLLDSDAEQYTPHGSYRISHMDGNYLVQAKLADKWEPIYTFDLHEKFSSDYEMFNWFFSTHPSSLFTRNLVVVRSSPGRRDILNNRLFSTYHTDGAIEKRTLNTIAELRAALTDIFLIRLPDSPELVHALHNLPSES